MLNHPLIQKMEQAQLKMNIPDFQSGDTLVVQVRVREGERERIQSFEGLVIAKRNRGLNSSFTVRKISHGVGVERTFQTHSPLISKIVVKRQGKVRRAKLYYMRGLTGKAARIQKRIEKPYKEKSDDILPAAKSQTELNTTVKEYTPEESPVTKKNLVAAQDKDIGAEPKQDTSVSAKT